MENENLGSASQSRRNYIFLTVAVFTSFAIVGVAEIVRGTALPRIQDEFTLTEFHLGLLLAVSSAGYLIACTFTAALSRRIGIKSCHILGLSLIVVGGVFIFFSPNFPILVLSFFILNLSFGTLEIANGVIAAKIFTKNTGTMMNLAHFAYGAGATLAPIISTSIMAVRFSDQISSWRFVYLIALSFAILPMIPIILGRLVKKTDEVREKSSYFLLLKKPTMWLIVMVLFFGLIAESGIVSWMVAFLEMSHAYSHDRAALHLTLYFVCFTLGRLFLGPFIDRVGFINSLIIVTAFAGVMITLGVIFGRGGSVLIVLAGIGIAPIFPTVMAVLAKLFSDAIEIAMTTLLTFVGTFMILANLTIGGVINQARVAFTASHGETGVAIAFSVGFLIFGIACFFSCAFALVLRHRQKKHDKLV